MSNYFRIKMNPDTGMWVVQLSEWFGLRWVTVRKLNSNMLYADREFTDFQAAKQWCIQVGIPSAYVCVNMPEELIRANSTHQFSEHPDERPIGSPVAC